MEQNVYNDFYFKKSLFEIFDVRQTGKLIDILNKNGIRYFENGHGDPFVPKSEFERKQTKKQRVSPPEDEWISNKAKS